MSSRFFCGLLFKRLGFTSSGLTRSGLSSLCSRLVEEEEGQTLVEYGLLISFIALVVITAVSFLGKRVTNFYNSAGNQLPTN